MTDIPEAIRYQATHPFLALPPPAGFQRVLGAHANVLLHQIPIPQIVEANAQLAPDEVDDAIDEARTAVRGHGKHQLVWLVTTDHPWLPDALASRGLRNEDAPGFEAVENAMVLLREPNGGPAPGVTTRVLDSFEDFAAANGVQAEVFGLPDDEVEAEQGSLPARWAHYRADEHSKRWIALLDDEVVGTGAGASGEAGVNLFGGAVLSRVRGRGIYRALTKARWDYAVQRGTPALTVQAGRMSKPILEQLGFEKIAEMLVYVDRI